MPLKPFLFTFILLFTSVSVFAHSERASLLNEEERRELSEGFSEWLRCSRPGAENCAPCAEVDRNIEILDRTVGIRCLPDRRQAPVVFNSSLSVEEERARDESICACYDAGNRATPTEQSIFREGIRQSPIEVRPASLVPDLQEELDEALISERIQTGFSAANYRSDTTQAIVLGTIYSMPPQNPETAGGAAGTVAADTVLRSLIPYSYGFNEYRAASHQAMENASKYSFRTEDFNGPNLPGYCIPYRHFLASKQFPEEREFYRDLQSMGTNFRSTDWNYVNLIDQLSTLRAGKDIEALRVDTRPEVQRLISRMEFLNNNPVIKNIFLASGSEETKSQLFNILREIPVPQCASANVCLRDENWSRNIRGFRDRIADFLTQTPEATRAAQEGFHFSLELNQRVKAVSLERDNLTSDNILGSRASNDPSAWSNFCRIRRGEIASSLAQARDIATLFSTRNFLHPENDTEYRELNEQICQTKRRDGYGTDVTFDDWFRRACSNPALDKCLPDNRIDLVAEYLGHTTDMNNPNGNTAAKNILPLLGRNSGLARVGRNDVSEINRITRTRALTENNFRSSAETSQNTISRNSTVAQAEIQSVSPIGPAAMGLPSAEQVFVPQVPVRNFVEENRASLAQGEDESRQIRDEIAELRNTINDPVASSSRSPQELISLTEQMAKLERRFAAKERENSELREQIANAEAERVRSSQRVESQVSSNDSRRTNSGSVQAGAAIAPQPQGGVSNGLSSIAPGSTGGQASLNGSGNSSASRISPDRNSALLSSKYSTRENSQGGITVADASTSVDYQTLRIQSENSIIQEVVSTEVFDQIAGNNQEAINRYLEQVRAAPGEVVRLNLSAGADRTLELFLVKNGDEISIVQGQLSGRSIASETAPEVIRGPSRAVKLDDLRNEFGSR